MFFSFNLCLWRFIFGVTYLHEDFYYGCHGRGVCLHLGPLCVLALKRTRIPRPLGLGYWLCEERDL